MKKMSYSFLLCMCSTDGPEMQEWKPQSRLRCLLDVSSDDLKAWNAAGWRKKPYFLHILDILLIIHIQYHIQSMIPERTWDLGLGDLGVGVEWNRGSWDLGVEWNRGRESHKKMFFSMLIPRLQRSFLPIFVPIRQLSCSKFKGREPYKQKWFF